MSKFTAVVSNYAPRGPESLRVLIDQIQPIFDQIIVVVNDDSATDVTAWESNEIKYLKRPNTGMNIGGWSEAIDHCAEDNFTIFLQDECRLVDPSFREHYGKIFANADVGMIAESLNPKWAFPWEQIASSGLNYQIQRSDGRMTSRVDFYRSCMRDWNIDCGIDGSHGRALAWAFKPEVLRKIRKFPIGNTKEECIAAEISVSKMVRQLGYEFRQSDQQPFAFFEHIECRKNGWSKK